MKSSSLMQQLQQIPFSIFLFRIRPDEEIILNKFYGSTIRGGFGYAFKKATCIFKNKSTCVDCILSGECAYSLLFESKIQNSNATLKTLDIPRPYILDIETYRKNIYNKNDILPLQLTLIGNSIKYLPYFFVSIQTLGETGFGYQRKNFTIESVLQQYPEEKEIYNAEEGSLTKPDIGRVKEIGTEPTTKLTLKFITPTRIKYNGKFVSIIEFHYLVRSLIHRITFLSEHWCDKKIEYHWNDLIKKSEDIRIEVCETRWVEFERYSTRQKTTMKLGGIVGEITYKGNIDDFLPLIILGSYLHTGKNTTFGLGKYRIENLRRRDNVENIEM
ncbi:MAG: CRISPR system precrRNA processing endoribonuclease RAMP protein Cas6 [bacterium]|nr:CRISPR system precrRNA processing endoribonuclease RAMP protein Cas6 [bacterium]